MLQVTKLTLTSKPDVFTIIPFTIVTLEEELGELGKSRGLLL
jgi:hypothetical protein